MLQSFVGTVGQPGLIAIRRDSEIQLSTSTWPSANIWAILDSSFIPEISTALRHNQPKRALQLLTQNAQSLGKLG